MLLESGAKLSEYYNTFSTLCTRGDCYYDHDQIRRVCLVVDQNLCQEDTEGASPPGWSGSHASVAAIGMYRETVAEGEAVATVYIASRDHQDEMSIAVAGSAVDAVDDTEAPQGAVWAHLAVKPRRGRFCFGIYSVLDSGFYYCSCSCCWHEN